MQIKITANLPTWIIGPAVVCLAASALPVEASDRTPKERMLAEYPAALRRLEEQYAREEGKAVFSSTPKNAGKASTLELLFSCDSQLSRTIEIYRGEGPNGYGERVRCSNPDYSFNLFRNSPDRPYVIGNVTDDPRRVDEFGRFYFNGFLAAPYIAFGRPVREIMEDPDFKFRLGDVSEVTHEGRRLFRISFEFLPAPTFPMTPAWIEVDPEYGWAVRRYEGLFGKNRDRLRTGLAEYSGMERGRPVVRHVVRSDSTAYEAMEIAELRFDRHPDPQDFTLSAFGLPEVNQKPGDSRAIPLNYWLFGFGAGALVLAVLIRRVTRHRPTSSLGQSV